MTWLAGWASHNAVALWHEDHERTQTTGTQSERALCRSPLHSPRLRRGELTSRATPEVGCWFYRSKWCSCFTRIHVLVGDGRYPSVARVFFFHDEMFWNGESSSLDVVGVAAEVRPSALCTATYSCAASRAATSKCRRQTPQTASKYANSETRLNFSSSFEPQPSVASLICLRLRNSSSAPVKRHKLHFS